MFKAKRGLKNDLHDYCATIKVVYVNSFFPRTARLRNSLSAEWFPMTYNLNGLSRVDRNLFLWALSKQFSYIPLILFFFFFLVTLVVAIPICMK